ncbi:deacetylase [Lithospermum erythrorhizon]|uniref:Deacetylase n=1 Tax=Lithospermum erythrorhizon TaxID=34254 RepID=A0AAV3RFN2_LITER
MNPSSTEIVADFKSFFRVYKDGHVERYVEADFVPPSEDPETGVISKDVKIPPENDVIVRLYLPKNTNKKLPLLIYIHGGGFCIESALSSWYHPYLNRLVAEANVIALSIEYRLAPEFPIPICYDDCWSVFKWLENGKDSEPWLRDHADFSRTFMAGDRAGANISHEMMVRASNESNCGFEKTGMNLEGVVLIHPFFGDDFFNDLWLYLGKESNIGLDDPRLNPTLHPGILSKIVCKKILICTAEIDKVRHCGWSYYEAIKNSGWGGEVEIVEAEGEDHVFHLVNPGCDKADILMKKMASFFN